MRAPAVLLLTAAGCSSPSNTATPASAATTAKTGTIVINPQFDEAHPFNDGLARMALGTVQPKESGVM